MTHQEKYNLKRENFKKQSLKHFRFLVDEYGYNEPNFRESPQPNGTVISDTLEYKNLNLNKTVRIQNNYHPVDYGFEFNLWHSITDLNYSDSEMLEYHLKENQDIEQSYIEGIAKLVKETHKVKLTKT